MRHARLVLSLLLFALAWPLWLPLLGLALVVAEPLRPADAVVPLAGGVDRVRYATALVQAGAAPLLLITDVQAQGPTRYLISKDNEVAALRAGLRSPQLAHTTQVVSSTYSELLAIRTAAEAARWRTLVLVSSPAHTRRVRLMANVAFAGSAVSIVVRPVQGYGYDPAHWWRGAEERWLTLREYPKLAAFLTGYRR